MGWTGMYETFNSKLDAVIASEGFKREDIVASNIQGRVVNLAYRVADGRVIGVVCLVETRNARTNPETMVKAMDEQMGPYECCASVKVLDALTPTDHEYATRWRAQCRARLEQAKITRERAKALVIGARRRLVMDLGLRIGKFAAGSEVRILKLTRTHAVVAGWVNVRLSKQRLLMVSEAV